MKKIIPVFLICILLLNVLSFSVFAAREMGDNDVDAGDWEVSGDSGSGDGGGDGDGDEVGLLGDANGDGHVDAMDAVVVANYAFFGALVPHRLLADVNKDTFIDAMDAVAIANNAFFGIKF